MKSIPTNLQQVVFFLKEDKSEFISMAKEIPAVLNIKSGLGEAILHYLCVENDESNAKLLISLGANINAVNKYGDTPLLDSVKLNYINICRILVSNNANLEIRNANDESALSIAVKKGLYDIVTLLLNSSARVDAKNKFGRTPFQDACQNKDYDIMNLLYSKGADVNSQDVYGDTALHRVDNSNDYDMVLYLMQHGANAKILNMCDLSADANLMGVFGGTAADILEEYNK